MQSLRVADADSFYKIFFFKSVGTVHMVSIASCIVAFNKFYQCFYTTFKRLGTYTDGLLKVVIQHYVCLKKKVKHFLTVVLCEGVAEWDKIHRLTNALCFHINILKVAGKGLPSNFYALITGYRVKTSDLKVAICRTLSHSIQIEDAEMSNDSNGNEEIEEESRLLENQENENKQDEEEQETNDNHQTGRCSAFKKGSSNGRILENAIKSNRKKNSNADNVIESDCTYLAYRRNNFMNSK
uniref:Uncharacterized protein n=1 Tax=Glossina palpalis gambiensis TaxID=67801 RepID=A0A1B0BCN2_9MUSC